MAEFVPVAAVDEIPPGTGKTVSANGRGLALFNIDGTFHAIDNTCAHMGGPLGEGEIEGETVTCPWHRWQFDVKTGKSVSMPTTGVEKFETKVEDGKVFVKIE